jgi:ureidoacrylate peracid hydrolase
MQANMITLDARPAPLEIDPGRTAVVVVDMQNSFASKGGMFDLAGVDISGADAAVEATARLTDAARKAGIAVIYLQMGFPPALGDGADPSLPVYHKELALIMMRARPELKLLIEGSWDWQIADELKPEPGDTVIAKTRYSGFAHTGFDAHLKARGIRHLLFAGIATNICVESMARDAYFHDYFPILVEDAMNGSGPAFTAQATLWNFEHALGWVSDTGKVIRALG